MKRNDFEDLCLARLARVLPECVAVTILADRGFGDTKLFDFLETLGFPNMPEARLRPLVARFSEYLDQHRAFTQTFAAVRKMTGWLS